MNADALIQSYVAEVVRHLPRRQRKDVAYELHSLLTEELEGRDDSVLEVLAAFGRPADVADRYRPAGFTVLRASEAPRFTWIALGGVVLQWVVTLTATYSAPSDIHWLSLLGAWWLSWGLGAFWWPGLLISITLIAAAITSKREPRGWTPREAAVLDRDRIRRPIIVLYIALGLVGAAALVTLTNLPSWLPQPVHDALELDPEFLAYRAPWVFLPWAISLAVGIALLVAGRWTPVTRRITIAADALAVVLLVWWVIAGPIFVNPAADSLTKVCLVLLAALSALDLVLTARQLRTRVVAPVVTAIGSE
jgi:hypothetical protein